MERYRIIPNAWANAVTVALAPTRTRLEDAVCDMGQGIVITDDRRIVAYHERHAYAFERGIYGNFYM